MVKQPSDFITLKMEALRSVEGSVMVYEPRLLNISEEFNIQ
jgi:hypothetical protein